ncbi:MAG: hypothetical protein J1F68_04270 [Clostridiales bacterium]|nr:hypothetical protein [Clostridiales bacterium]
MKLRIKARGHNIYLWFPTSLLKSRIAYSIVKHAVSKEVEKRANTDEKQPIHITRLQHLKLYRALKQCIKDNGHFNIIEVKTHDGEKVIIRV